MDKATERKRTNLRALSETMADYIDGAKYSSDTAERWLCSVLEPFRVTMHSVLSNRLSEPDRKSIAEFRAAEIAKDIAAKRKEIERLERDLATTKL
jgi:hypothetical protein